MVYVYIFEPTSYTVLYKNWQNYFMLWLAECRAYGENGMDIGQCSSMGGSIACADCDRFFNVKRDMCPVMCGLCDRKYTHIYVIHNWNQENFLIWINSQSWFFHTAPCNGKKCENGGKLNVDTCTCKCEPPCIGDRCQQGRWSSTSVVFRPALHYLNYCKCELFFSRNFMLCKWFCFVVVADCSKPDKDHCPAWPSSYCDQYNDVPQDCPKKCGLC